MRRYDYIDLGRAVFDLIEAAMERGETRESAIVEVLQDCALIIQAAQQRERKGEPFRTELFTHARETA